MKKDVILLIQRSLSLDFSPGLGVDGVMGKETRAAFLDWRGRMNFPGFRGRLSWLHDREGHAGRIYWPGGRSGLTADPGADFGHAPHHLPIYAGLLTVEQMHFLDTFAGKKSAELYAIASAAHPEIVARHADKTEELRRYAVINGWLDRATDIRISRNTAALALPEIALPYWVAACKRWPDIVAGGATEAPPEVHESILSIAYNRGAGNGALGVFDGPIDSHDWRSLGEAFKGLARTANGEGLAKRRKLEGDHILAVTGGP
jgi:hypothetical protein